MSDLLYVHPFHPLAAQITFYYRLSDVEKFPWPIDTVARYIGQFYRCQFYLLSVINSWMEWMDFCAYSGGMNGFLCLTKRNGLKQYILSPVNGLEDISNNQIL